MDLGLDGKVALVTGGSKGIGRGIAEALAAEGAQGRDHVARRRRAPTRRPSAIGARGYAFDSDDLDAIAPLLDAVTNDLGPIDVYIANTGGPPAGDPLEFTREQWEAAQRTLLISPTEIIQRVLPGMRERGFGRVVAIGSMAVREPIDALQLSNAHRPGLVAAFKVLARQYAADGVTFNTVHPGQIATDRMIDTAGSLEAAKKRAKDNIPAGRLGTVEELAAAAVFFASQPAGYITGTTRAGRRRPDPQYLDCAARPHGVTVSTRDFQSRSASSTLAGGIETARPALLVLAVLLIAWPDPARANADSVGHHAMMIDTAAKFPQPQRTAARRDVVVLQSDRAADARRLKAHNKRIVVLAYLNLSAMAAAVPSGFSTGVQTHAENWRGKVTDIGPGYAARNERWFLHDRKGRMFTFRSYDWLWAANISDPSYQRRWASNALRLLAARPEFDGIFIDDVNPTIRYHHDPADVRELPTDEAYAAATGAGAGGDRAAHPGGSGVSSTRTSARGRTTATRSARGCAHLDGAMDEQWVKFGERRGAGYRNEAGWTRQVENVAEASAAGVDVMTITRSARSDAAAARYGYASALLASRGRVLFAFAPDYSTETWSSDYQRDLGAPAGPMETHESGLRTRAFKRGLVVVNPTTRTLQTESGVTLRPHSAVILQASSGQWPCASKYSRAASSFSRSPRSVIRK